MSSRAPTRFVALRTLQVEDARAPARVAAEAILGAPAPNPALTRALLLGADVVAVAMALVAVVIMSTIVAAPAAASLPAWLWSMAGLCLVGFAAVGLYPGAGHGPVEELRRVVLVTLVVHALFAIALASASLGTLETNAAIVLSWASVTVLVLACRASLRHHVARHGWWGLPVMVLGAGPEARLAAHKLAAHPGLDLKIVGWFADGVEAEEIDGIPVLGSLADVGARARALSVHRALIAMPNLASEELGRFIQRNAGAFHEVFVVANQLGVARPGLATHDLGGVIALSARQHVAYGVKRFLKRAIDLSLLVPALLVATPLIVLGAIAVWIVSPGNPFYMQWREGLGGRPIGVLKLRSMHRNAEALLERHLEASPAAREEWDRTFKLREDPRILPVVGGLLRRSSLDELPQLWNILKGEMSFVGPRPFPEYHLAQFDPDFRALRRTVLPGLTGLWQVSARSDGDLMVQEDLDSYYIRNWSVWLDLYLLVRTPIAVLSSRGAY